MRSEKNTVLVDSSPLSYALNYTNCIPCTRFKPSQKDHMLPQLLDYLHSLIHGNHSLRSFSPISNGNTKLIKDIDLSKQITKDFDFIHLQDTPEDLEIIEKH